jgi:hypothetical protein
MNLSLITVADFKAQFVRDFVYGTTTDTVMDADISRAFSEAIVGLNQALYTDDTTIKMVYLYLAAHYLVLDIRAANANIEGSGFFPVNSRSAGSVSESYAVPQAYLDSPILSIYSQTQYGMKFLALTLPMLAGNVVSVYGGTSA